MENFYIADSLIGHLSARKAAVACIALDFGKIAPGEDRDEILRDSCEHLGEDGSILVPWRPGILIACWGQIGNPDCALKSAARALQSFRDWMRQSDRGVSLRISLDACEPSESSLSYRRAFSQLVREALRMAFSFPVGRDIWVVANRASTLLDSRFSMESLAGEAANKPWKEVLGRKEIPFLPLLPLEWIEDAYSSGSKQLPSRSEGSILNPLGMRELSLAECTSPVPIVLVRPKWGRGGGE